MTSIEWTDKTWNPIVGCSIVSPGCTNCYAMKMAARLEAIALNQLLTKVEGIYPKEQDVVGWHYDGTTRKVNGNTVWTGKVAQAPEATLLEPLHRKKPTMYFVNSMGDLFHEDIPDEWIDRVFAVMALCPQHTFQVLTKRAERMRAYMLDGASNRAGVVLGRAWSELGRPSLRKYNHGNIMGRPWPLPNVWLGVSCERQQEADERIPLLLQTPAAIRFISAEPLIGPIYLKRIKVAGLGWQDVLEGWRDCKDYPGRENVLDWVIVGGESGPKARPMHPDWARKIRDDCGAAGVAFFFKQWGEWAAASDDDPDTGSGYTFSPCAPEKEDVWKRPQIFRARAEHEWPDGAISVAVGKKRAGRWLDSKHHNEFPKAKAGEARAASRLDPPTEHPVF